MRPILLYLLLITFTSCKNELSENSKKGKFQYLDYSSNKYDCIYKLRILDDVDDEFYDDKYGYSEVKLTPRIYVKDKCFGIRNEINFDSAEKYVSENGFPKITITTNISLPTRDKKYKTVWRTYQHYQYDLKAKAYLTFDAGTIELRQGEINYNGRKDYRCLKIIRQNPDENNGFKMQILSFIKLKNSWKLAQREKINTEKEKTTPTYCFDTISDLEFGKDNIYELNMSTFENEYDMICQ